MRAVPFSVASPFGSDALVSCMLPGRYHYTARKALTAESIEAYRAYRQKGKSEAPTVHLTQDVAQSHEPAPSLAQAMSAFEHS